MYKSLKGWAPAHITVLREKLCKDFIRTGDFDPETHAALAAYAKLMRSKRPDGRRKSDDICVVPVIDSNAISPKYAAYLVRQRNIANRNNGGGLDDAADGLP